MYKWLIRNVANGNTFIVKTNLKHDKFSMECAIAIKYGIESVATKIKQELFNLDSFFLGYNNRA